MRSTAVLAVIVAPLVVVGSGSATSAAVFRGAIAYEAYSAKAAGLEALDVATGKTRWLIKPSAGARGGTYEWVTWSPDGKWLAFTRWVRSGREDLFVLHAGTGRLTNVTASATACRFKRGGLFAGTSTGYGRVRWSPDGTSLAFTCYTSGGDSGVYVVRRDGANLRRLEALPSAVARDTLLSWSTGGTRLAYLRWREGVDRKREDQEIVVASLVDGEAVTIPTLPATEQHPAYTVRGLAWQPSGNRLLYTSISTEEGTSDGACFDDADYGSIYTVIPPGTMSNLLLRRPGVSGPAASWSPTGGRIAYWLGEDGCGISLDLWVMKGDGKDRRSLITSIDMLNEDWAWARTRQEILVAQPETNGIWAVNVVTSRRRRLATLKVCCGLIHAVGKNAVAVEAFGNSPRSERIALVKLTGGEQKPQLLTVKSSRAGMKLDTLAFDIFLP